MATFKVTTQLMIDKASATAGKAVMEGITKAAMQLSGALLGGKLFLAPFKAMNSVIEESIAASEKASAAQDRMRQAMKNVYSVIGDQMTPGLNELAISIQSALNDPAVMDALRQTGQLLGDMAVGVSSVVDAIGGFSALKDVVEDIRNLNIAVDYARGHKLDVIFSPVETGKALAEQVKGMDAAVEKGREHTKVVTEILGAVDEWRKGVGKQAEAEKKAAELRKRAHEEHLKNLQAIIERLDPVAKAEREYGDAAKVLNEALRAGEISVSKYQDVLGTLAAQLRIVQDAAILTAQAIEKIETPGRFENLPMEVPKDPRYGGSIEVGKVAATEYEEAMKAANDAIALDTVSSLGGAFTTAINEFAAGGDDVAQHFAQNLLDGMLQAAEQYLQKMLINQATIAGAAEGSSGQSAAGGMSSAGWVGMIAGFFFAIAQGISASKEKKYGKELGSEVNYGIEGGMGGLSTLQTDYMKRLIDELGESALNWNGIIDHVSGFLDAFNASVGGQIETLGDLTLRMRNDGKYWEVSIAGVVIGLFDTIDKALVAGVQQAIASGQFTGVLDPILKEMIAGYQGSADEFLANINAVQQILNETSGLSQIQLSIRDLSGQTSTLRSHLQQLGLSMDSASVIAAKWEAVQLQNIRDQITGHQASVAEQMAQKQIEADMFNAQLALNKAKNDAEILDLQNQIAIENAKVDVMNAANQAAIAVLNASLAAYQQIAQIYSQINPIGRGEIHINGGHHGGGGGNVNTGPSPEDIAKQHLQDVNDFLAQQADLARSLIQGLGGQLENLNHWYEEQTARATELGIPLDEINRLYEAQLYQLQQGALQSLGLQSVETDKQFNELADTLKFLKEWGAITDAQLRELGDNAYLSLADGLLQYVDNEEVRAQLEDLRFRMEIANYKAQFAWLQQLGLLTQAEIDVINGLFTDIQDAYEHGALAFQNPNIPDHQTNDSSGGTRNDNDSALRAAIDRLTNIAKNINQWVKNLALSSASPLTTSQQFAEAQRQYFEMLAAAQGGDLDAMEGITAAAQTYLDLAAQQFGTSGAGYQAMFDLVRDQVAAIGAMAQQVIDGLPPQMQGTEDRLDTLAEIMRAIAIGLLGSGAGGIGAGGSTGGNGLPPGWNPNAPGGGTGTIGSGPGYIPGPNDPGMGHYRSGSLGSTGNLTLGNFSSANGRAVIVRAPELEAKVLELANAQAEVAREAKKDRNKKAASGLAGFYGAPIGSSRAS